MHECVDACVWCVCVCLWVCVSMSSCLMFVSELLKVVECVCVLVFLKERVREGTAKKLSNSNKLQPPKLCSLKVEASIQGVLRLRHHKLVSRARLSHRLSRLHNNLSLLLFLHKRSAVVLPLPPPELDSIYWMTATFRKIRFYWGKNENDRR